jgi:hypothetical protein
MARTRWPPGREPWPVAQARQHRDGTAGGCHKTWDPGRQAESKDNQRRQPINRSGRDPGHRPYARTTPNQRKQGRNHTSTSSLPNRYCQPIVTSARPVGTDTPFMPALVPVSERRCRMRMSEGVTRGTFGPHALLVRHRWPHLPLPAVRDELFVFTQYIEITLFDLGRPGYHLRQVAGDVDVAARKDVGRSRREVEDQGCR